MFEVDILLTIRNEKIFDTKHNKKEKSFIMAMIPKRRKQRFAFTIDKDIRLLRLALCANTWQTGHDKWNDVVKMMEMEYHTSLTPRTLSGRINLLRENFRKQQLKSKTGKEEEETERGRLLMDIEAIISEEDAAVEISDMLNDETDDANGNDDEIANDDVFLCTSEVTVDCQENNSSQESDRRDDVLATLNQDDDDDDASNSSKKQQSQTCNSSKNKSAKRKIEAEGPKNVKQSRIAERQQADAERQKYLDEADEPVNRRFRGRLSIDDEMIMKRQDHEIEMDKQRLVLDKERLEIVKRREMRLEEEARRRDELQMSQLLLHQTTMALIGKSLNNA